MQKEASARPVSLRCSLQNRGQLDASIHSATPPCGAFQNSSFNASCPMRGSRTVVTTPKVEAETAPDGFMISAWFETLKNSARNWGLARSLILVLFKTDMLLPTVPDLRRSRRHARP